MSIRRGMVKGWDILTWKSYTANKETELHTLI